MYVMIPTSLPLHPRPATLPSHPQVILVSPWSFVDQPLHCGLGAQVQPNCQRTTTGSEVWVCASEVTKVTEVTGQHLQTCGHWGDTQFTDQ